MLLSYDDLRAQARNYLPRFVFDYVDGGAEDERCLQRNRSDLEMLNLVPTCLSDTSRIDCGVEVFGQRWNAPLGVAPLGFCGLVRPRGDLFLARAAASLGLPSVLSTASNSRLEAVREAALSASPNAEQWIQLYVMSDRKIAEQILRRAAAVGFGALVLTVDVPVSGYRERDVRNGFSLPFRPNLRTFIDLVSRPQWSFAMARSILENGLPSFVNLSESDDADSCAQAQGALFHRSMDRTLTWDSLAWLRQVWKGPLLIKGVLNHNDAIRSVQHGVDGLIVSNHGGRQLDAAPSTISVLPGIMDVTSGRIPVFVDSGFRRGSDVTKALALGAQAVFVGRHALWGLAVGGEHGARFALKLLADEVERTMSLLGASSIGALKPTHLWTNALRDDSGIS